MAEVRIGKRHIGIFSALIAAVGVIASPVYIAWQVDVADERAAIHEAHRSYEEQAGEQIDFLRQQLRFCVASAKDNGE